MSAIRLASLFVALFQLSVANASLITSAGDISGSTAVVSFDDHPVQEITLGPVQLAASNGDGVLFTATNSFEVAGFSAMLYGLGRNGTWDFNRTFAWVNPGDVATMRFAFLGGPVSAFGAFLNYCFSYADTAAGCGTGAVYLRALDAAFNVIEEYRIDLAAPIDTPDLVNDGAFRGISRAAADIYAFEMSGAGVLDDLTFTSSRTSVPEPSAAFLLVLGLVVLGSIANRGRAFRSQPHCAT